MPRVFDPFAGGGAIPLEAARLGCRSFGNDLNPVAHIIQRGSLEFPQKYGKPILYSLDAFNKRYGTKALETERQAGNVFGDEVKIANRLAFDVAYYAKLLLERVEAEIGQFYPPDENGNKPIAYYWARVGKCANPACGAEVPLLRNFYLCDKEGKKVGLKPIINGNEISFNIQKGHIDEKGWMYRANLKCPVCGNLTDVKVLKEQFVKKQTSERLIAVIEEGENSKAYRLPSQKEFQVLDKINNIPNPPNESMDNGNYRDLKLPKWGFKYWREMFSPRQLLAIQTFVDKLQELKEELRAHEDAYWKAVVTYLGIWVDRVAVANTSFGRWNVTGEKIEHPFSRQAIPMVFDYPESNIFCDSTGSAKNQLKWIVRYLNDESATFVQANCINASSGEKNQFPPRYLSSVVTDPPYYDAIAYADLSDFFYVWLKRTIGDLYPTNFAYPQTPKTEECTALKHHHNGDDFASKKHFENKLQEIFGAIEKQTHGVISVMFAHQSTTAWTTLVNSILGANMNISSSWPFDSEMGARMIAIDKAALASSVTVSCRPTQKQGYGDYREVKRTILEKVKKEVKKLYAYGFRGADLLTACFGQAVSEFGQYKAVEKASGERVSVAELLEMAREAAFNAIVSDIATDEYTRFYLGWLQLFGFSQAEHDTVRKITQIGLDTDVSELSRHNLLITKGNKQTLATYAERIALNQRLGQRKSSFGIDQAHQAMHLYKSGHRNNLLAYLSEVAAHTEAPIWRVLNSLAEILPSGMDDHKQVTGLLTNKESLIREAQQLDQQQVKQMGLFDEE